MGIGNGKSIKFEASEDRPNCVFGEVEPHTNAPLVVRDGFGGVDGLDVCLAGEDSDVPADLVAEPVSDCVLRPVRNGIRRVLKSDGSAGLYGEPQPDCGTIRSAPAAGGGSPIGDAGRYPIATNLSECITSGAYPMKIRVWLDVCDWLIDSGDLQNVGGYYSYESSVDNGDPDDLVTSTGSCLVTRQGGSFTKLVDDFVIDSKETFCINMDLGLEYFGGVSEPFTNRLGSATLVIDYEEITAFGASVSEVC